MEERFVQLVPVVLRDSPGYPASFYALDAAGAIWYGAVTGGDRISIHWARVTSTGK